MFPGLCFHHPLYSIQQIPKNHLRIISSTEEKGQEGAVVRLFRAFCIVMHGQGWRAAAGTGGRGSLVGSTATAIRQARFPDGPIPQ